MKVLITGAKGMLGRDLVKTFQRGYDTLPLGHEDLDVTDRERTIELLREIRPDLVIHSAGYTDVDGCEDRPEEAYRVNGLGTRNVAEGCGEIGAVMVYISTDYVFDGKKGSPYLEMDDPCPVNIYGASKLMGEGFVRDLLTRYYIIRTSWLFGKGGANFVKAILEKAGEGKGLEVVDDQFGSPTYTVDLSEKIEEVVRRGGYGIYHITNSGHCSWFDFACEIVRISNPHHVSLKAIKSWQLDRRAKRPAFSVLDNLMLRLEGIPPLRSWKEALQEYLHG